MTKKFLALFTVVCVMASMLVIPNVVYADYTSRWTDSFEEGSGSVVSKSGYEYVSSGDNGLFASPYDTMGAATNSQHLTLDPTAGYNGTAGLYVHCDTSMASSNTQYRKTHLMTRGVVLGANDTAVLRYKIKFNEMGTMSGLAEYVMLSGVSSAHAEGGVSWKVGTYSSSQAADRIINTSFTEGSWDLGKWYTIVTCVSGTTAAKSTKTYILNEDNTVKSTSTKTITVAIPEGKDAATEATYFWPITTIQNAAIKRFVVDDVSLSVVNTADSQAISFDETGSNIKNGETGVAITKAFRLTFDHDLASGAADAVKLYKATDTEKTSPVACTVSASTFDGFLLTPDSELEIGTEYVLDFSGVTSAAGAAIATASQSIRFTTTDKYKEYYYDSFENGTVNYGATTGIQNYVSAATDSEANSIFQESKLSFWSQHASIADNSGYDGGKALYINCDGNYFSDTQFMRGTYPAITKTLTIDEDNAFLIQYKVKFEDFGTGTFAEALILGGFAGVTEGNDGSVTVKTFKGRNACYCSSIPDAASLFATDTWYTVVVKAEYDSTLDTVKGVMKMINDNTGELVTTTSQTWTSGVHSSGLYTGDRKFQFLPLWLNAAKTANYSNDFKGYIDDFSLIEYSKNNTPALYAKRTTLADGATNVSFIPEIDLVFDMAVNADDAAISIYKKDDAEATVNVDAASIGYSTVRVSPTTELDEDTEYILAFSGVKSDANAEIVCSGTIAFKTTQETIKVTSADITITDGVIEAGSKTVSIRNVGDEISGAILFAAIYDNEGLQKMTDCIMVEDVTLTAGTVTEIPLEFSAYAGVGSVKLILINNWDEVEALMKAYDIASSAKTE